MAQLIKTKSELKRFLENKMEGAINIICNRIEQVLKDNIIKYTYNYDPYPNSWYQPTYEFYDSFYMQKAKKELNGLIRGWVIHDYRIMSAPRYNGIEGSQIPYQHGDFFNGIDRRKELANILNVSGENGSYDFRGKQRQPFFDLTIQWIEENWFYLIDDAFSQVGLKSIHLKR